MAADFAIRINRREGILEVEGPDKEWIAEQLDRLAIVFSDPPAGDSPQTSEARSNTSNDNQGTSGSKKGKIKPSTPRARRSGSLGRAVRKPELEQAFTSDLKSKLQAYVEERGEAWNGSQPHQATIIATFLMDNLNTEGWLDKDDLYTIYSLMGWSAPSNYRATLNNARNRNGHFGSWVDGRVQITHAGEQYGRHTSKNS